MRLATGLRVRLPQATVAALGDWPAQLGISRVTDITRLDRLGLPVFASVRPRGRTLRVHAGKGLDAADARTGATVEAIELALAERDADQPPDARLSLAQLQAQWPPGVAPQHFAPDHGARLDPDAVWPAVRCECLQHGRRARPGVLLPDELVRLPSHGRAGPSAFAWSSNGLAAGNSLAEATLHALLELLERDTVALHGARDASRRLVALPPPFDTLARDWAAEGVTLIVRELPNAFGLPCFTAHLHEAGSAEVNLAAGSGLHLDRDIALARAVSEAAQSRLSTLHGGRDDVTGFYAKYGRAQAQRQADESVLLERLHDERATVAFSALPERRVSHPVAALAEVRARLAAQGMPFLMRHRLGWPAPAPGAAAAAPPLAVVKLVVPGLEMLEAHNRRIGPRLLARLAGHG